MKHMKNKCIGCERSKRELLKSGIKFNKEHFTPKWLITLSETTNTLVKWAGHEVPAINVTIPLCEECNTAFGNNLEGHVAKIFEQLENGLGITDYQAELLVRWMWKFEGVHWHLRNDTGLYSEKYTLKQRVLQNIDAIRPNITLSVSIIDHIRPEYTDRPMGIDSMTEYSGLFVSGVFSMLAIITSHRKFDKYIPSNFTSYHLAKKLNKKKKTKVFYPKTGFIDDSQAVGVTVSTSKVLEVLHDRQSLESY